MKEAPFCSRPFFELMMGHDGEVHPCCLLDEYAIGNIKQNSMEELWNSEKLQSLREEFLTGNIKTCSKNISLKSCHKFYDFYEAHIEKKAIQTKPIQKLDLRLNGKCNLKCIMCDVWKGENGNFDKSNFWQEGPASVFPYLKHIDLLGGEPFVQADSFRLIDEVSKVNKDCSWSFTTNGNWNFKTKLKQYFDKIKIDSITISMDAVFPMTYAKIRQGGNYQQAMQTIDDLLEYKKELSHNMILKLDFVLQKDNYQELIPFYSFCEKKDLIPSVIYLTSPVQFAMDHVEQKNILQLIKDLKSFNHGKNFLELTQIISNLEKI